MKKFLPAITLSLMLLSSSAWAEDTKIDIKNYAFIPKDIMVAVGTKVTWTNLDQIPHGIADKNKTFRSSALDTNESYSYTYTKPGVYQYFCTLHPQMLGSVTVK